MRPAERGGARKQFRWNWQACVSTVAALATRSSTGARMASALARNVSDVGETVEARGGRKRFKKRPLGIFHRQSSRDGLLERKPEAHFRRCGNPVRQHDLDDFDKDLVGIGGYELTGLLVKQTNDRRIWLPFANSRRTTASVQRPSSAAVASIISACTLDRTAPAGSVQTGSSSSSIRMASPSGLHKGIAVK